MKEIEAKTLKKLEDLSVFKEGKHLLLAVSGGVDSMCLAHLFLKLDYPFTVAHCNFKLRGEESDAEEELVKSWCKQYQITCFTQSFPVKEILNTEKRNLQDLARELRYNWFEELIQTHDFKGLVTAHHLDDQLETVLMNLTKKGHWKTLLGIQNKDFAKIRPLLNFTKQELKSYAEQEKIPFLNDSSNLSLKYQRNRFRNIIIPQLKEENPVLFNSFNELMSELNLVHEVWQEAYLQWKFEKVKEIENGYLIVFPVTDRERLFFREFLNPFGFSKSQLYQISSHEGIIGKKFESEHYLLAKERGEWFLRDKKSVNKMDVNDGNELAKKIKIEVLKNEALDFGANSLEVFIDGDKIEGVIYLRKWKRGDAFVPFGMRGMKKVSDFFIDEKFSAKEKEKTWLLCDKKNIIWIVGYRLDNRYKVTPISKNVLKLSFCDYCN